MALPSILTGKKPSSVDVLADLSARINAQGLEIARLSRELSVIRAKLAVNGTEHIAVERSGCTLIADRLGINERTVRGILVDSDHFAKVRAQSMAQGMPITRNKPFLAWLADNLDTAWPRKS
jgi:hypothetical protein